MCQIVYTDLIEIVKPELNSRKTIERNHEHYYHYMTEEERKRLKVKSKGIGIWLCRCGKVVHSM
jgi:hypothetical protein